MEEGGLWWFWLVALVDYKIMSSSFCVVTHGLSISKVPMCKYSRGITQYCCVIVGFPNRQADRHTMIIGNHEQTSLSTTRNMEATVQERHYPHILLHRQTVSTRKLKMHARDSIHDRANEHYIRCSFSTRLNGYAFLGHWDTRKQHAYNSYTLPGLR